jgi:hypothetical protein
MQRLLRICKNPGGTTPNKQTEEEKAYVGKSEGKMGKSDSVFSAHGGLESTKKDQGQNITEINQKNKQSQGRDDAWRFVPDKKRIYRGTFLIHIHLDEEDH